MSLRIGLIGQQYNEFFPWWLFGWNNEAEVCLNKSAATSTNERAYQNSTRRLSYLLELNHHELQLQFFPSRQLSPICLWVFFNSLASVSAIISTFPLCTDEWNSTKTCETIFHLIHTVLAQRVAYFVLLYYSHKSGSIFKTRDRFEICWSWCFQNTPYMSNLTKFWLRYLRLKTHDTILLISW